MVLAGDVGACCPHLGSPHRQGPRPHRYPMGDGARGSVPSAVLLPADCGARPEGAGGLRLAQPKVSSLIRLIIWTRIIRMCSKRRDKMRQEIRTTTTLWRAGIVAQTAHRARVLINARFLINALCVIMCVDHSLQHQVSFHEPFAASFRNYFVYWICAT